ncbi:MAG: GC-type dockerin domain-anchored protein [Limnohabitans sp.]|nr:GC-type dockerin domain-anchored protein [Limnohabitans sp.]
MLRHSTLAVASLVVLAAGIANADKISGLTAAPQKGAALGAGDDARASKREMPKNDDFQSISFRAGAGGSSPTCCPADLDCNGIVDASDLATLLGSWGACSGCQADINQDGLVDAADLATLLGSWGVCVG